MVLGISMGGLVARYGLADLTKRNIPTGTRLLITQDSPHRGANTPLAFQYATRFLASLPLIGGFNINSIPAIAQANQVLDEPATTQMLIWRATGRNSFVSNTFLDGVYRNMITFGAGNPTPTYRLIATSNGSECGINTLAPEANFVNINGRFIVYRPWIARKSRIYVDINLKALPNGGTSKTIAYINVSARIKLFFQLILGYVSIDLLNAQSPANTLPWDGVPGGTQPIRDNLPNNVPTRFEQFIALEKFSGWLKVDAQLAENFCFVPTVSALDITTINSQALNQAYVSGISPSNPSRMNSFIAQEPKPINGQLLNSTTHPSFTGRNAEWIFDEMEGVANTLNCSNTCRPPGMLINGVDLVCSNSTFILNANPSGVSISWSATPTGVVSISPNGAQATITKITSGQITLMANIADGCGSYSITKSIHIGGFSSSDYPISGTSSACKNVQIFYSTVDLPGATNYQWTWPPPPSLNLTYLSGQGTRNLTLRTSNTTGQGIITVRVSNSCDAGGSPAIKSLVVNNCGYFFMASPNPSSGNVNITAIQAQGSTTSIASTKIYQLKVVDQYGVVKKQYNYPAGVSTTTIVLNDLVAGIYTIQAFNGSEWGYRQVIKQ